MAFSYLRLPSLLLRCRPPTKSPSKLSENAASLYDNANVTYRGTDVGRVKVRDQRDTGVRCRAVAESDIKIPADLEASWTGQTRSASCSSTSRLYRDKAVNGAAAEERRRDIGRPHLEVPPHQRTAAGLSNTGGFRRSRMTTSKR